MGRALTPVIRAKKLPRGKPFPKGNAIGVATRFVPGVCPNPGGRPKSREVNAASREFLGSDTGKPPKVQTNAEFIVAKFGRKAKSGDLAAAIFLAERAEGKPATAISVNDGRPDNLTLLIESMHATSERIGMPEGHREPTLLADGSEDRSQ